MANPLLSYHDNLAALDKATQSHTVLSCDIIDGELKEKRGFGWLYSAASSLWWRVYDQEKFERMENEKVQQLFHRNCELLSKPLNDSAPHVFSPSDASQFAYLNARFASFMTPAEANHYRNKLKDWIIRDISAEPYVEEFLKALVVSGIDPDDLQKYGSLDFQNLSYTNPEQLKLILQCTNLLPKFGSFLREYSKQLKRFSPYLEDDPSQTSKFRIQSKFLPKAGELPLLDEKELKELKNFLIVANEFPFDLCNSIRNIAQKLGPPKAQNSSDNFIGSMNRFHEAYINKCKEKGIPFKVLIKEEELLPTNQQLEIACEVANDLFKALPPLESDLSRAFYARVIQFILVGDDRVLRRLPYPPHDQVFTTQELKGLKHILEIQPEYPNFIDWYFFHDQKVPTLNVVEYINQFFKDLKRSIFEVKIGNRLFSVKNFDQLKQFLGVYRSEFEKMDKQNMERRLKIFEAGLGQPLSRSLFKKWIEQAFSTSFKELENVKNFLLENMGGEDEKLWRLHLLTFLCLTQQTPGNMVLEKSSTRYEIINLLFNAFESMVGFKDFSGTIDFDKRSIQMEMPVTLPISSLSEQDPVRTKVGFPSEECLLVRLTRLIEIDDLYDQSPGKNHFKVTSFMNPRIAPYMVGHIDKIVKSLTLS